MRSTPLAMQQERPAHSLSVGRAAAIVVLAVIVKPLLTQEPPPSPAATPAAGDSAVSFEQAVAPREFRFPRDHGSHPAYKTEWWYVTGALVTADGRRLGVQATWFRSALVPQIPRRPSRLATRDIFIFHGALSDVDSKDFRFVEQATRGASSWAGASEETLDVHVWHHRLRLLEDGSWRLRFRVSGSDVELRLRPRREPLLHGETPGLSQKGSQVGQASYYYSQTRLHAEGTVRLRPGTDPLPVEGSLWFDHEFGSNQLAENQVGWDWFSVALDDGTDLMLYQIRRDDGSIEPHSSGTVRIDGKRRHVRVGEFEIIPTSTWKSPHTGGTYPSGWTLRSPADNISLRVEPVLSDQEVRAGVTTGVSYWEGLCRFEGNVGDRAVRGHGYVELVGYAGAFLADI